MPNKNEHITPASFERLYTEYKPRFILIAQSYIRDAMAAEDIVTDSFLYFWEHRDTLHISTSIPAYILGSVKNGCLEWLRNQKNRLKIQQKIHTTGYQSIQVRITALEACDPKQIFAAEISSIIRDEVDKMPAQLRDIFLSSRLEGKTYQEIAEATGISVRSVKAAMQKALGLMRQALKDYLPSWAAALFIDLMQY